MANTKSVSCDLTPFPYTGSKRKEHHKIAGYLTGSPFIIEPFAGTAYVSGTFSSNCIINDAFPEIYMIWKAVMEDDQSFYEFLSKEMVEDNRVPEIYYDFRTEYNSLISSGVMNGRRRDLFYFMLSACHGSFLRFNSQGLFNMPFKRALQNGRKFDIERRIAVMKRYGRKIQGVACLDALSFLKAHSNRTDTLFYCDPPYINSNLSYGAAWNHDDLSELDDLLAHLAKKGNRCMMQNYPDSSFLDESKADQIITNRNSRHTSPKTTGIKEDVILLYGYPKVEGLDV